jgi:hypothetical protein
MIENNNHITNDKIQELCDLMESFPEDYKHLQVFLHRERDTDSRPDDYFLMVTPRVFGKVKVLDLTVEGDYIFVKLLDCFTKHVGSVKIDIHDASPATFFICWQDVRKMMLDETANLRSD